MKNRNEISYEFVDDDSKRLIHLLLENKQAEAELIKELDQDPNFVDLFFDEIRFCTVRQSYTEPDIIVSKEEISNSLDNCMNIIFKYFDKYNIK